MNANTLSTAKARSAQSNLPVSDLFGAVLLAAAEVVFERLPACESVIDLVPVADFGLPQLPAKENLTTFPYRGEVNESTFQVLDFTTFGADLRDQGLQATNEVKVPRIDGHSSGRE
jgi:hypothetical protein